MTTREATQIHVLFCHYGNRTVWCSYNTLIAASFHSVESGIMEFFIGLLDLLSSSSWHEK